MKKLAIFLIFVAVAGLAMAGLSAFTELSSEWMIIIPSCIAGLGLFAFLSKPAPAAAGPTASSGTTPTPAQTAETATLWGAIFSILFSLLLLAVLAAAGFWLYRQLDDWIKKEAAKPTSRVVNLTPIGHDNNFQEGKQFRGWLNPGIEYSLFELKKGWGWSMFFDKTIAYRIRQTGEEPYITVKYGGTQFRADYDGWLEVITNDNNNWLSATQRIYKQAKIEEYIEKEKQAKEKEQNQ